MRGIDSPEPWGFDYLCPLGENLQTVLTIKNAHLFHKSELEQEVSMIIDGEGKALWWDMGISDFTPVFNYQAALALIPDNYWCCLFDGHL